MAPERQMSEGGSVTKNEIAEVTKKLELAKEVQTRAFVESDRAWRVKQKFSANMEKFKPALEDSFKHVHITEVDISRLRSMKNPCDRLKSVLGAVCILKGIKPQQITNSYGQRVWDYWGPSMKMLADIHFLKSLKDFDKDNIPAKRMAKLRAKFTRHPFISHSFYHLRHIFSEAIGLSDWVLAMDFYDQIVKANGPGKDRLLEADKTLEDTAILLAAKGKEIKTLERKLAQLNGKSLQKNSNGNVKLSSESNPGVIGNASGSGKVTSQDLQTTNMSGNILVTCATGSLGQLTIDALLAQKVPPKSIFAECRDPKKPPADALGKKGVTVRKADFTDINSMTKAMAGIQTLMFISSGSLDKRYEQHANVLSAAKTAGVKHIVYTSILKCSKDSKYLLTPDHVKTEEALLKSGIPYTIFRNTFYMDLIPYMLGDALSSGQWSYPAGDNKVNFVAKCDIAEGLAKVLGNLGPHLNKIYEIASCKSYTFAEIAPILSKVSGKSIVYNPITVDQFKAVLKGFGMSEFDVKHFASSAEAILAGQLDSSDLALDKILGHKTKTMEDYLPVVFKK